MTPSSEKRVCLRAGSWDSNYTDVGGTVCVSSLLVDEIKRIIKTSEIMKYVASNYVDRVLGLTYGQGR